MRMPYLHAVMSSLYHWQRQLSSAGLFTGQFTTIILCMLNLLLQVRVQLLIVIQTTSVLKCFFVAAAEDGTTQGAAVALPVAVPAAMAAPVPGKEAVVASATQGELQKYIVNFLAVIL